MRHINEAGLNLVKSFEGLRLKAYDDLRPDHNLHLGEKPEGTITIGYGHTRGVFVGMTCTEEQAEVWLKEDLSQAELDVQALVTVPLNDNEFSALVSGQFNSGWLTYKGEPSTLRIKLNSGDRDGAVREFRKWVYCGKKMMGGLILRRAAERILFNTQASGSSTPVAT